MEDMERKSRQGPGKILRGFAKTQWRNSEGEALADFGVDDSGEEDDIPLAELMRRRKAILDKKEGKQL